MTIAVVALYKDGFYIVADTNSIHGSVVYTKNTKKVFFSNKHKILLCFADNGILNNKDTNNSSKLHVDYVIKTFFDHLEKLNHFEVRNLTAELIKFVDDEYPHYHNYFRHQTNPDNYISYFYGGFQNGIPTIYSHHKGRDSGSINAGYHHFFANTNAVEKSITSTLSIPDAPKGLTSKDLVTDPNYIGAFLKYTIPLAAISLNQEDQHAVGNYLHMIHFRTQSPDAIETMYEWKGDTSTIEETKVISAESMPTYLIYKNDDEEKKALLNGQLKAYFIINGAQASFFDDSVQTAIPSFSSNVINEHTSTSQSSNSNLVAASLISSLQNIDEQDSSDGNIYNEDIDSSSNDDKIETTTEATSHSNINQKVDDSLEDNEVDKTNSNTVDIKFTNDFISNELLNQQLSWIYQLPQWLQDQMLNSTPIKTLIESITYSSTIYRPKSVTEDFYEKMLHIEQDKYQGAFIENDFSEKVQIDDTANSAGMIDMSMILLGSAVGHLILPTILESISLPWKDNFFMGEDGFNLLNGIELF